MSTIINFKCKTCDFEFQDTDLIFYIDDENRLKIESLDMENSKKMSNSPLSGYLYENYCPHCQNLIRTFVPQIEDSALSYSEINENLNKFINESDHSNLEMKNIKILNFDFKNTFYKTRRNILENNSCPNCNGKMALVISNKIPCPKCGGKIEEVYEQ